MEPIIEPPADSIPPIVRTALTHLANGDIISAQAVLEADKVDLPCIVHTNPVDREIAFQELLFRTVGERDVPSAVKHLHRGFPKRKAEIQILKTLIALEGSSKAHLAKEVVGFLLSVIPLFHAEPDLGTGLYECALLVASESSTDQAIICLQAASAFTLKRNIPAARAWLDRAPKVEEFEAAVAGLRFSLDLTEGKEPETP